jgi:chloramphenicol 3-O-phosphotransferase
VSRPPGAGWPAEPTAILLFGHNCSGKSSVAPIFADLLERAAFIEVDDLRYMVRGGLVAFSRGRSPVQHASEYERQFALAARNAVALCHEFARDGFSTVVEGLGDECRPDTDWIRASFPSLPVRVAALVCDEATLRARCAERDWPRELDRMAHEEARWYRENCERFECVLDTSSLRADEAARILLERLAG